MLNTFMSQWIDHWHKYKNNKILVSLLEFLNIFCEFVQISGLTLAADEENLALVYLATIQALAVSYS